MNYSFNDDRSEMTRFCEGDSVRAYSIFGAHIEQRNGKAGVLFRVWAPNAAAVSVVGVFNDWSDSTFPMVKGDCGVWELFIEGVEAGQSYQYSIETAGGERLLKADPYAFCSQMQPKRASRVYDLSSYQWNDSAWRESRRGKDSLKEPMNLYEVHLGSWKRNADGSYYTYRQYADELTAYVTEMIPLRRQLGLPDNGLLRTHLALRRAEGLYVFGGQASSGGRGRYPRLGAF